MTEQPTIEHWQQQIAQANSQGLTLEIRGGGSKSFYGQQPQGQLIDTRAHSGIVSYEPTELVVTARTGTPLAELEATLAEQQQMLAFEPPHFGPATVGGSVATGLSGPRRARVGSLRDFVLGTQLLDGNGNLLEFGGQVMKNVAGYDVSRFLAGSLGILGIITEVSLKVLPLPESEQTLCLSLEQGPALISLCEWASQPLPISATAWHQNQLHIRLSGASSAVKAAANKLGGEMLDETAAKQFWQQLKEQQLPFFTESDTPLWRVALPATTPELAVETLNADNTLLEWNGTQRWLRSDLPSEALRQQVTALGGHATLFRGGDKSQGVFTPLSAPLMMLHNNLKQEFDPKGVFNPGRLYPTL